MARPRAMTEKKEAQFIKLLEAGNTIGSACELLKVGATTVLMHRRANPDFDALVKGAVESRIMLVEDALYVNAMGGNVTAQIFFLINRTRNKRNEDSTKWLDTKHLTVEPPESIPPEQIEQRIKTILARARARKEEAAANGGKSES